MFITELWTACHEIPEFLAGNVFEKVRLAEFSPSQTRFFTFSRLFLIGGTFRRQDAIFLCGAPPAAVGRAPGRPLEIRPPCGPHEKRYGMSELEGAPRTYSGAFLAALGVALVGALAGLFWSYSLSSKLTTQQAQLTESLEQNKRLAAQLRETDARLKVATEELGASLGLTQKQLDAKAEEILRRESAQEVNSKRLEDQQKQTAQQVSSVSNEVGNVKTEVGGVKSDVAKTQSELATTISQLQTMKGDLSDHGSLIARNHDELELLRHKGDRNFYEFTIVKNQRKPVGTISLELKKADPKHNSFTLVIYSDDKPVTKKDRGVNEPLQFYSGKDPMLFEVVVNSIGAKDKVSGYLSVPKNAPVPPSM